MESHVNYAKWRECIEKDDIVPLHEGLFQDGLSLDEWIRRLFQCCERPHDAEKCLNYIIEWGISHIENIPANEIMFKSILIYASCQDSRKCLTKLLEYVGDAKFKLSVDDKTDDHWTALHYCAYNGYETGCKELIRKGADASAIDSHGYSPLIRAAETASPEALSSILAAKPDINHQNNKKWAALHFAAHKGSAECISLLIRAKCNVDLLDENNEPALMKAVRKGASRCVHLLLQQGANMTLQNVQGKTAAVLAVEMKSSDSLGVWIKHANDTNSVQDAVKILNIRDNAGFTPLISAAKYKNVVCLDLMLSLSVDAQGEFINATTDAEESALMWAAKVKSLECVQKLIAKKADVKKRSKKDGATALHFATKSFSSDIILALLEGGAELDAKDDDMQTALDYYLKGNKNINYDGMFPFVSADVPIDKETQQLLNKSFHSWFYFLDPASKVNEADVIKMIDKILTEYPDHAYDLCHTTSEGRDIFNIVTPSVRKAMENYIYFYKRYNIGKSVHKSATSHVMFAHDVEDDRNDGQVALKFFREKTQFEREIEMRKGLDNSCVIPILNEFDSEEFYDAVQKIKLGEYRYMISMPASDKSLDDIIRHDSICGDYEKIRVIILQICKCLKSIHIKGKIHGDLKPLNIMRDIRGQYILIDLDACVKMKEACGVKLSTSYLPPEMIDKEGKIKCANTYEGELVVASYAFDAWALGVILYQLCTGETLWKTDIRDNLVDVGDRIDLREWSVSFKVAKLRKIGDSATKNDPKSRCRSLLSQLLSKDPKMRPDIDHVISHPFITGHETQCRLPGQKPNCRVFLSYRVAADKDIVHEIFEALKKRGVTVWYDKVSLNPGENWETGFVKGLASVDVFVPVISRAATQNFTQLKEDSPCDNVLLEHRLALELLTRGMISKIVPILVGDKEGNQYNPYLFRDDDAKGISSCKPQFRSLEPVVVRSIEEKTAHHLENMGLGMPYDTDKTVESISERIFQFQGAIFEKDLNTSIEIVLKEINKAISIIDETEELNEGEVKGDLSVYKQAYEKLKFEHKLPANPENYLKLQRKQGSPRLDVHGSDTKNENNDHLDVHAQI